MKKILLFFVVSIFFCLQANAQIHLEDSTVHVVAYWSIGDKHNFKQENEKIRINGNDTTSIKSDWELFSIEVVDTLPERGGYILEIQTLDKGGDMEEEKNEELDEIMARVQKNFDAIPLRIKTTDYGTYEDVANWDEIKEAISKFMAEERGALMKLMSEDDPDPDFNFDEFFDKMMAPLFSKEMILASCKQIIHMFKYHGLALDMNEELAWEEKRMLAVDRSFIDTQCVAWVDDIDVENGYAYVYNENIYNTDQLMKGLLNYVGGALDTQLNDDPERPYVQTIETLNMAIHVNSGWTISTFYELEARQGKDVSVTTSTVNMVFD